MGGELHRRDIRTGDLGKGDPEQYNYDAVAVHLKNAQPVALDAIGRAYAEAKRVLQQAESDLAKHASQLRAVWDGEAQQVGMGDFKRLIDATATLAEASGAFEAAMSEASGVIRSAPGSLPPKTNATAPWQQPKPGRPDGSLTSQADDRAAQAHLAKTNTDLDAAYAKIPQIIAFELPDLGTKSVLPGAEGGGRSQTSSAAGGGKGGATLPGSEGAGGGSATSHLETTLGPNSFEGLPSVRTGEVSGTSDLQGIAPSLSGRSSSGPGGPLAPGGAVDARGIPPSAGIVGDGLSATPPSVTRGLGGGLTGPGGSVPGRGTTPAAGGLASGAVRAGVPGSVPMMPAGGVLGGSGAAGRGAGAGAGQLLPRAGGGALPRGGVIGPGGELPSHGAGGGAGGRGGSTGDESRAWLVEDDSVWAEDHDLAPRVIGKPEDTA